jgi:hypothetical protein
MFFEYKLNEKINSAFVVSIKREDSGTRKLPLIVFHMEDLNDSLNPPKIRWTFETKADRDRVYLSLVDQNNKQAAFWDQISATYAAIEPALQQELLKRIRGMYKEPGEAAPG